jgi:aspartate carbamoyltransferase catalytic subunit
MRDLLDFAGWSKPDAEDLFATADVMAEVLRRPVKRVPALQGFTVCTAFFENSTRTRTSFELAARRMSADVVSFAAGTSSLAKGESLRDTVETLVAMGVDLIVVRHSASGAAHLVRRFAGVPVINGGDGARAHPTQALLDAYTLRAHWGELSGKRVVILGDVLHSRVARSNLELLPLLGAKVVLCGPANLLPQSLSGPNLEVSPDLDSALDGADAVMALRVQRERLEGGLGVSLPEYAARYQLNRSRLDRAGPRALLLHPGPMNRDVEISSDLAGDPRSCVLEQVHAGLAIRMAVLYHLLVGKKERAA